MTKLTRMGQFLENEIDDKPIESRLISEDQFLGMFYEEGRWGGSIYEEDWFLKRIN